MTIPYNFMPMKAHYGELATFVAVRNDRLELAYIDTLEDSNDYGHPVAYLRIWSADRMTSVSLFIRDYGQVNDPRSFETRLIGDEDTTIPAAVMADVMAFTTGAAFQPDIDEDEEKDDDPPEWVIDMLQDIATANEKLQFLRDTFCVSDL